MAKPSKNKPGAEVTRQTLTMEILSPQKDHTGKDEMNLAEFPITVLAARPPKGVKTLIFTHGKGRLVVTGSDAYGLPTALDDDVILALIQLTKQKNNFTEPTVHFTRYELIRLLGWANEGRSYHRIDESLKRWSGVLLVYEKCWWDNRARRNVDANIHILDEVVICDGKGAIDDDLENPLPLSSFTWNSRFMESFQADNLKDLDLEIYFSLKWMPSKRLYRFLDKRFYKRSDIIFPLEEIAFTRVGLSIGYAHNVGKIKEKLQPAISELEAIGFLEPMSKEDRYQKEGKNWKIRLAAAKVVPPLPVIPSPTPTPTPIEQAPEPSGLAAELIRHGVGEKAAVELTRNFTAEVIEAKIEECDWLLRRQDKRVAKNPAGYLVKSILDGYGTPKGFVSQAEEQRRAQEKADADRKAADLRGQRQREEVRERAELKRIDAHWESLTAQEQAAIDAQAHPDVLKEAEGPIRRMSLLIHRREYIRRQLQGS